MKVLSWGAGVQSTCLAAMSALGCTDRLDLVLHADTGWERKKTYEIRDWYVPWLQAHGLRVEIVSAGNVRLEGAHDHVHIPFWTETGAPLNRQCTRHFKIDIMKRFLRKHLGYTQKPPHPPPGSVEQWMGITTDEKQRAKKSRVQYIRHRFPLLELGMDRQDCADWLKAHDLPVPIKSACIGCPFRRASEWLAMKEEAPEEWADAVAFDKENRNNPLAQRGGPSIADELFIWREAEPLDEADLEFAAATERRITAGRQLSMFPQCESGFCGV